ncbi:TetR/AcrR family transcriptional regulator [Undibacterium sp. TS12]|uniref:TetR/AcrR family transcriptional regulator n=1 Tax=Undibacterium sp. TS12 TaxID=2908202 RepID=UPI001F4CDB68|nr:TetR/AcrR family transcriptional regulator [Undibacterium sp. TS12]MCH8620749.1 TetR/AcrR family transcriptional regulator [Undibacterium sp. TS12]
MTRRDELRDNALDYFLSYGLAELSLRPLAEKIGSSARLLIYHFESKEKLITVVMEEVRSRVQQSVVKMMQTAQGGASMETFWCWITDKNNIRYVRLLFEVQVLAMQNPAVYAQYLSDTSSSWLAVLEHGIPESADRRIIATLCSAVIDGLVLEYMSTGDFDRTTSALKFFVSLLSQHTEKFKLGNQEPRVL